MTPAPRIVAILAEDTEYGQTAAAGARANIAGTGLKIVYDRTYPPTLVDHSPIVRAIEATGPDLLFVASYPAATVNIIRFVHEIGFQPRMLGGPMIGAQFSQIKAKLGPLLNGLVVLDNYVPEPTMKFPGVEEFLKNYQARAAGNGVDPLGYWAPFAYASPQIIDEAVTWVGKIDQAKIARYIHEHSFATVVSEVRFDGIGEWVKTRFLFIQYQTIQGNDIDQFRQAGKQIILYPPELKFGNLIYPFARTK